MQPRGIEIVPEQNVTPAEPVVSGGYRLELADAMTMDLLTTPESDEWVRKVARAMRLRRGPAVKEIEALRTICESGPQAQRYGVLTLQSDGNGTHLVSGVGATRPQQLTVREVWQSFYPFYQPVTRLGGLPLHSALVQRGAWNVLLAAPAGTGKSTCCRRLPIGWKAICNEEVVWFLFPMGHGRLIHFPRGATSWSGNSTEGGTRNSMFLFQPSSFLSRVRQILPSRSEWVELPFSLAVERRRNVSSTTGAWSRTKRAASVSGSLRTCAQTGRGNPSLQACRERGRQILGRDGKGDGLTAVHEDRRKKRLEDRPPEGP